MKESFGKKGLLFLIFVMLMSVGMLTACSLTPSYLAASAVVEAGRVFTVDDFVLEKGHKAEFDSSFISKYVTDGYAQINHVGDYKVGISVDGRRYTVKLKVTDQTAPSAVAKDMRVCVGAEISPELCVTDVTDATDVTYSFKTKPDTSVAGINSYVVVLKDEAGNSSELTVNITVVEKKDALQEEYQVEAGTDIPAASTLAAYGVECSYITDVSDINIDLVGSYEVLVNVGGEECSTHITIVDTVAPIADVVPQVAYLGAAFPSASAFVKDVVDAGPVKIYYESEQEEITTGPATVRIVIEDQGGNKRVMESYVTIAEDKEAPVFLTSPDTLEVEKGKSITWRSLVSAEDNSGYVEIDLDTSAVNFNKVGDYTAYFVASDMAGNVTKKAVLISVKDMIITDDMMNQVLDTIIAKIITNDMTAQEKIYAVYKYIGNNISYVNSGEDKDLRKAAYLGLTTGKKGDCFTFCAAGVELLNRLGYQTMVVSRSPEGVAVAGSTHKWVLVNIGDETNPKWYHFDATPQPKAYRKLTYLMTAAQAKAYTNYRTEASEKRMQCYFTYDPSLYPEVSTEILVDMNIDAKYFE